jgi:hypothetical protein
MKRLREYTGDLDRSLLSVVDDLSSYFGKMERVGGNRVYDISNEKKKGVIFLLHNLSAIGLGWNNPNQIVSTIYYWNAPFDPDSFPNYAIDLPNDVNNIHNIMPDIVSAIKNQKTGEIEI